MLACAGNASVRRLDDAVMNSVMNSVPTLYCCLTLLTHTAVSHCGASHCCLSLWCLTGDRFLCHCDEAYVPSVTSHAKGSVATMSMISVNIYMNGGFEGGRTRFFLRDDFESQLKGVSSGGGGVQYHVKEGGVGPDVAVVPAAGRCLLFQQPPGQCYYHDGEQLGSECKYLFRSDVMYRRVGASQRDIR